MDILIGFEESATVREAFRSAGFNAISCDLKPSKVPGPYHYQCDIFEALYSQKWDLFIAHPPCTFLSITANKWLKDQAARKSGAMVGAERREAKQKAVEMVRELWKAPVQQKVFENPVGVLSTLWKKPNQIICPTQFGHKEPKKTCLWIKGLPHLKPTKIVEPEYHITKSGKRVPKWFFFADKSEGQEKRAEIRSKTFPGVSDAMVKQWGPLVGVLNGQVDFLDSLIF